MHVTPLPPTQITQMPALLGGVGACLCLLCLLNLIKSDQVRWDNARQRQRQRQCKARQMQAGAMGNEQGKGHTRLGALATVESCFRGLLLFVQCPSQLHFTDFVVGLPQQSEPPLRCHTEFPGKGDQLERSDLHCLQKMRIATGVSQRPVAKRRISGCYWWGGSNFLQLSTPEQRQTALSSAAKPSLGQVETAGRYHSTR